MDRNYYEINRFIKGLKVYIGKLSKKQIKTLRGQAISGDLDGAKKGLERLINKVW